MPNTMVGTVSLKTDELHFSRWTNLNWATSNHLERTPVVGSEERRRDLQL